MTLVTWFSQLRFSSKLTPNILEFVILSKVELLLIITLLAISISLCLVDICFVLNNINLVFLGLNTKLLSLDHAYILFAAFVNGITVKMYNYKFSFFNTV